MYDKFLLSYNEKTNGSDITKVGATNFYFISFTRSWPCA